MPSFVSPAKALARLLSRRNRVFDSRHGPVSSWRFLKNRGLGSIARIGNTHVDSVVNSGFGPSIGGLSFTAQARWFLGVGESKEEGDALSKVYEERRIMGYSQEQLFAVVAAVDLYEDFIPWCQRSQILKKNSDGSFDAELEIGFKFLVESYVSHVEMKKPTYIKVPPKFKKKVTTKSPNSCNLQMTTASETGIFDHLINIWKFNPGPVPGSCDLYFLVDFKFKSPLYRQVASVFFKEVVARLVGSFNDRCHKIYGPGVQVLENAYTHGR